MRIRSILLASLLLAGCENLVEEPPLQPTDSFIVVNATLVDGTGAPARQASVRVEGGRIVARGALRPLEGERTIDASGLTLVPGFIDTHSHHDETLWTDSGALAPVSQGITTIVAGNDGSSTLSFEELLRQMRGGASVNLASYSGHGSIRSRVMGGDYQRTASATEINAMIRLLEKDMAAGSLGLSTGLEYDPGIYSQTSEVVALARVAARYGGRYISHMRSEDRAFDEALEELLQIGREAQIPVQVSHIKLASTDLWHQAPRVIQRLDQARAEGIEVSADIYPYTYWSSSLTVLLPERNFHDLDAARYALEKLAPAEGMILAEYVPNPDYVGRSIADIAAELGQDEAVTYLQLIRNAYAGLDPATLADMEAAPERVIGKSMIEEDIATLLSWPHTNLCSDGADGGHPRGYGAFPRALRQYVNEQQRLSLESMIHKMTGLSAGHIGIERRGLVLPGYAADLVLLDMDTISDHATIAEPRALSSGVLRVWVNGKQVWDGQRLTGARPGVFLARGDSQ